VIASRARTGTRYGHGQRVVDDVERVERVAKAPGQDPCAGHRGQFPGVDVDAGYAVSTWLGSPSPASWASVDTTATASTTPLRASPRASPRAYVSLPPLTPGTSVNMLSPTRTGADRTPGAMMGR
jgi:hypothetical protein